MSIQQMQQQLIDQISNINDVQILQMLNEELKYSLESRADLSELLTKEDLAELKMLSKEPIDKNTISLDEFNSIMDQWRMK